MGICQIQNKAQQYQSKQFDGLKKSQSSDRKYHQDPNTLNTYNVILTNIKLKIQNQQVCQVQFDIAQFSSYQSPISYNLHGRHIFKPDFQTSIIINEENLRRSNLEITVKNSTNDLLSKITINLYEVATGPPHFDYDFQATSISKKSTQITAGKISFDLKLSQVVVIQLQSAKVICSMEDNLNKQSYSYSMRLVVLVLFYEKAQNQTFYSDYSESFINPAYITQPLSDSKDQLVCEIDDVSPPKLVTNKQFSWQVQKRNQLVKKHSRQNSIILFNDHQVGAGFKQLQWNDQKGILLDVEVPINQISAASVQLCFWGSDFNEELSSIEKQKLNKLKTLVALNQDDTSLQQRDQDDMTLICETYISLNQLFKHDQDENFQVEDGIRIYQYSQTVNKGLWIHGRQEGDISCQFNIRVPAYLKQSIVGVRTNQSIQQTSSVFNESHISVQEIFQLQTLVNKLIESVFKLQEKNQNSLDRSKQGQELNVNIFSIIEVLEKTHKESIMSFYYKSQDELCKAQTCLLQLAYHLTTTADELDDSTREKYYHLITLIMNRGELALNQMKFSEEEKKLKKLYKQKLSVGLIYQKFLYKTLKRVLEKLKQKVYSDNERQFIEGFCARAYFQIPEFRSKFQACLIRSDDPTIVEWRGTEYKLDQDLDQNHFYNKDLIDLFDWEQNFYQFLDKEQKGQENLLYLKEILAQSEWQKRFGKRSKAFFMFLREWCNHVDKKVIVKEHIPWQDIPGYRPLIKAFLIEVKTRDVKSYPFAMKQTMFALLQNQNLLNIIIVLLFNKTNLNDSAGVIELFEILNEALQSISKNKKKLPSQVDWPFFLKGIKTVLFDCEHAFCLSKCIWMLYNNYTLFPFEFKKDLCDLIFPNIAYKLFMHWSSCVRLIFHHFLLFRIYHLHRSLRSKEVDEEDLCQSSINKYSNLENNNHSSTPSGPKIKLLYFLQQMQSDFIYVKYSRVMLFIEEMRSTCIKQIGKQPKEELSYAQKMRRKLMLRKANETQSQDQQDDTSQNQMQYLIQACVEFEEIKIRWAKWRQKYMNQFKNLKFQNDEERDLFGERFEIPLVTLQVPVDERESNIFNDDDW